MGWLEVSLYSYKCCSNPYEAVIDEPCNGDIIKLIPLIKILTTWVFWSEGQRDGRCQCVTKVLYFLLTWAAYFHPIGALKVEANFHIGYRNDVLHFDGIQDVEYSFIFYLNFSASRFFQSITLIRVFITNTYRPAD